MSKICYVPKKFGAANLAVIEQAEAICQQYAAQGYTLTLRQLYYQFVSRDLIANQQREYKRLGEIVLDARLAGLIDWTHMEDRTRNLVGRSHWWSPASIMRGAADGYYRDQWEGQANRVEVWVEKDALVGILEAVCQRNDVAYFSCRGYTSASEMWSAGQRLGRYARRGQAPVVLHFGDHDPSGIQMTEDILGRLEQFSGTTIQVERLALNMDQVRQYNPPPNPAKTTDSRYAGYIREYGLESWELDALEPSVIDTLVQTAIDRYRDQATWAAVVERQERERGQLTEIADRWDDVIDWLDNPHADTDEEDPDEA